MQKKYIKYLFVYLLTCYHESTSEHCEHANMFLRNINLCKRGSDDKARLGIPA